MPQIVDRGEMMMRNLVDIECKFRLNMLPLALCVVHDAAILRLKLRKLHRHSEIRGL